MFINFITLLLIKIAIVDTGLDLKDPRFKDVLCSEGHKDFTGEGIQDTVGHGTHVAGLTKEYAKSSNYCFTIYKFYSIKNSSLDRYVQALKTALESDNHLINSSAGGTTSDITEKAVIARHPKKTIIASAGNDNINLDKNCTYYPVCYGLSNVLSVGSYIAPGIKSPTSNYGEIVPMYWEIGENVLSTLPNNKTGRMSGTSMAAAIYTGKLIYASSHSH